MRGRECCAELTTGLDFVRRDRTAYGVRQLYGEGGVSYSLWMVLRISGVDVGAVYNGKRGAGLTIVTTNGRVKLAVPGKLCQVYALYITKSACAPAIHRVRNVESAREEYEAKYMRVA